MACAEQAPDWLHIVEEYDPDEWVKRFGPPARKSWSHEWSRDGEHRARELMREGLVTSIHIILGAKPCTCCPGSDANRVGWDPYSPSSWTNPDGWDEELEIHDDNVVERHDDPDRLGPDPEDLTAIPEPGPVDLDRCQRGEMPDVGRHVTIQCVACMDLKDEHDRYADSIRRAWERILNERRQICVVDQFIDQVWSQLTWIWDQAAGTDEVREREAELSRELAEHHAQRETREGRIAEAEAMIAESEAKRQEVLSRLVECEETMCRLPADDPAMAAGEDAPASGGPSVEAMNPPEVRTAARDPTVQLVFLDTSGLGNGAETRSVPGGGYLVVTADGVVHLRSLGGLGAGAVEMTTGGAPSVSLADLSLVVEPVELTDAARRRLDAELGELAARNPYTARIDAYCLEFLRRPPEAGTVFRLAGPGLQARFAALGEVLDAGRRLRDAGLLNPDSDPDEYYHSVRQWSLWTVREGLDAEAFGDAFVAHVKSNFEEAGEPWTGEVESLLRELVPGRWSDIQRIVREAGGRRGEEAGS